MLPLFWHDSLSNNYLIRKRKPRETIKYTIGQPRTLNLEKCEPLVKTPPSACNWIIEGQLCKGKHLATQTTRFVDEHRHKSEKSIQ